MMRLKWCVVTLVVVVGVEIARGPSVSGQTAGQRRIYYYAPQSYYMTPPVPYYAPYARFGPYGYGYSYGGASVEYGISVTPQIYSMEPIFPSQTPDSPVMAPQAALPANVTPWSNPTQPTDPAQRPVIPSSAGARLKSLEYQAQGDQNVRQQAWQRAYANYRQAVRVADDQAAAHLRFGIVLTVLRRYDVAEKEFQRAVFIDPQLPASGFNLETLFGPDSKLVRSSILARTSDWVNEDITDPQRLFILGVMLHFNGDDRAKDLFAAAREFTRGASHIVAFLPQESPTPDDPDRVSQQPSPITRSIPRLNLLKPSGKILEAPPAPGIDEDVPGKQPDTKPDSLLLPQSQPEKSQPTSPDNVDGPVLLPPSPAN